MIREGGSDRFDKFLAEKGFADDRAHWEEYLGRLRSIGEHDDRTAQLLQVAPRFARRAKRNVIHDRALVSVLTR